MDLELKGKERWSPVLVIACLMAAEGTEVIVHDRNEERAAAVAKSINDTGGVQFMCWATCRQTKVRTP
jgi:hypothetical protein